MMRQNKFVYFLAFAALILTFQSVGVCRAESVGVIVPAYFYPGTGGPGGVGDGWAALTAAASKIPVTAVFNPDSGPLPGPADPNYSNAMTNLEAAGGKVVAYVYTDNGNATLSTVEGEMNTYITQYGSKIDGFYLDSAFLIPSTLSYYGSLDSYVKGLSSSYSVISNSGQPFLNGVTPADYLATGNTFDIFEGPNTAPPSDPGFNNYPYGLNWFQSYPSADFDNTIFNVPTSADMLSDLNKAVSLNAGDVYITDQTVPNPYGQLPSYWDQEVAAIQGLNSTPLPGTIASAGALMGILVLSTASKRRAKAS